MMQQAFARLKLSMHPDKTCMGRIEKGFDFLGYHFSRGPIRLAHQSVQHFVARLHRLYEQQKKAPDAGGLVGIRPRLSALYANPQARVQRARSA